ncbi:MAG: hypothetical protein ACI92E_001859 [Oceanicoccus sp.]|jgi:hypothetical protein
MNLLMRTLSIFAIVTFATQSFAAKPLSIRFIEDVVAGESIYSHYIVICSNDKKRDISSWNNRRSWCEGKGSKTRCKKKQLKTAKNVCKKK